MTRKERSKYLRFISEAAVETVETVETVKTKEKNFPSLEERVFNIPAFLCPKTMNYEEFRKLLLDALNAEDQISSLIYVPF